MSTDEEITKKKTGKVQSSMLVWVLMAMLITGLGGFGVTNFGRSVTAIGSVGDQEIPVTTYARALRNQINALSRQFGQPLGLKEAQLFGLDQQVLSGLIANAALDNEAQRVGLSVGDAAVATRVASDKSFQDPTGKFDAATYRRLLEQNNMTVKDYEAALRADIARTVLQSSVVGGITAPVALTDTLYTHAAEQRSFTLLRMTEATLPTPIAAATDSDVKAFYDANLATFTRPEAKRITYATLRPADLAPTMQVAQADIQALYDSRKADYVIPEKRLVERLVYPTEAEAQAAKARLDAGTPFETLVTERGLDLTAIDLGDVSKPDLGEAGAAVFALTAPGVVGPLNSNLGPALFRMNAILPAQDTKLADVQTQLQTELQTKAAVKAIADQTSAIEDALAGGATLEDLVKEHAMTLITIDYAAGADDNDPVAADRAFANAADKLATGDYPEAISLTDGGLVALRLDATVPPTPVPLDKIRDKVATAHHTDA
ncbi:MAG: SurA N-terminal domain-containing protein, partial [Alphaproteobacteria bacterium]